MPENDNHAVLWKTVAVGFISATITMAMLWISIGRGIMTRDEISNSLKDNRKEIDHQIATERAAILAVVSANSTVIAKLEASVDRVNGSILNWLQTSTETKLRLDAVERLQRERIDKLDKLLEIRGSR